MFKNLLKKIIPKEIRSKLRIQQRALKWYLNGKKTLPPGSIKRRMIKKIAKKNGINIFVETGTAGGATVEYVSKLFDKIISIEVYEPLARAAQKKFARFDHIKIMYGDSGDVLPDILEGIKEPVLFWLDGHYSGEGTGKGVSETPITKELVAIFHHPIKNHIILIDDSRCFDGTNDYPKIEELKDFIKQENPNFNIEIKNDIIIIK